MIVSYYKVGMGDCGHLVTYGFFIHMTSLSEFLC